MGTTTQEDGPSIPPSQPILPVAVISSQGPGVPPAAAYVLAYIPPVTLMPTQGPGVPPAMSYVPPVTVTPTQGQLSNLGGVSCELSHLKEESEPTLW